MSDELASPRTAQEVVDAVPEEVTVASSVLPYDRDNPKAMYLGYRVTGFSVREALQQIGRSKQWLSEAKKDHEFAELCKNIPSFRKQVSKDYLSIEFYRNFRLVLEKDYRVLRRSLGLELDDNNKAVDMTPADYAYLGKMRSQYTPQQLGFLEALVLGSESGDNFAKWVASNPDIVKVSRTDSITLQRSVDGKQDCS